MALGAQRSSVYGMILKEAISLTGLGIALGIVCSLPATAMARTLLFGIHSWDVPTLGFVATVLAVSAVLASYLPARRAASINPIDALRAE